MKNRLFLVLIVFFPIQLTSGPFSKQDSVPNRIINLFKDIAKQHKIYSCDGGDILQFINVYKYKGSTLYEPVFSRGQICPDYSSQIKYYDSIGIPQITVRGGGLIVRNQILPPGTDLKLLRLQSHLPARTASELVSVDEVHKISPAGFKLMNFYDQLNVENAWLAGNHINWFTGIMDRAESTTENHTHCSAFVASACKRMGVYILRPPDHKQLLLSNAQYDWLISINGRNAGWKRITAENNYERAQSMANQGMIVLAAYKNPEEKKPGHIALVRPADFTINHLKDWGPEIIMAGTHNHQKISLKTGFKNHIDQWPENQITFFYNNSFPVY